MGDCFHRHNITLADRLPAPWHGGQLSVGRSAGGDPHHWEGIQRSVVCKGTQQGRAVSPSRHSALRLSSPHWDLQSQLRNLRINPCQRKYLLYFRHFQCFLLTLKNKIYSSSLGSKIKPMQEISFGCTNFKCLC